MIPHLAFTGKAEGRVREVTSEIYLSLPFIPKDKHGSKPKPYKAKALWDTGASNCAITKAMAEIIGLPVIGKAIVSHADGETQQSVYLLNLFLPNKIILPMVKATECKSSRGSFDFIIGMDIITLGDFALTNVNNKSTISFVIPPLREIDYVQEVSSLHNKISLVGRNDPCPCGSGKKYKYCHGKN